MALALDSRQRAMLLEMGVRVWLPAAELAVPVPASVPKRAQDLSPAQPAIRPAPAPVSVHPVADGASKRAHAVQLPAPPIPAAAAGGSLPSLAEQAAACQACALCHSRKHATLQEPVGQADWLVLGDPPDDDEDRLGQPFAGDSGVLLDAMLRAVGARRGALAAQGAHLSNVVKCRPPPGRTVQADEIGACADFLRQEIARVQPRRILALGRSALLALLADEPTLAALPLDKLRGRVYRVHGVPVVASYTPQMLLRNPALKARAWADLCLALEQQARPEGPNAD